MLLLFPLLVVFFPLLVFLALLHVPRVPGLGLGLFVDLYIV